jgi:hypothetical protein
MSANEEVEEHIHHAQDPFDKRVAGTMAIIAALLAIVSVLGQHYNTEKLLSQQQASDQWAFSQAKDIRRYMAQVAGQMLAQVKADPASIQQFASDANKYKRDTEKQREVARDLEKERDKMGRQADFFHFGEVFLELAIVLSSLSILTKRHSLFWGGAGCAVAGFVIALYGWMVFGLMGQV